MIEHIANEKEDYILITRDNLDGVLDKKMYIKQIRLISSNIKIIYIVDTLDKEYKEFLFANEVFNIIEMECLSIDILKEAIEDDGKVVYKSINSINEGKYDNKNLRKMIAVFGTNGAGKSYVSSLLVKKVSKKISNKIALIDMNLTNPSIDILNNLEINTNGLLKLINNIDNDVSKNIEKYMLKDKRESKIFYLTNSSYILDKEMENKEKCHLKLYNMVKQIFDTVFIDLSSDITLNATKDTLKKSDIIYFVVNPQYISIRQAIKYLEFMENVLYIKKEKINIIVNKSQKDSLGNSQIKSMLYNYKVIGNLPYNPQIDSYINGALENFNVMSDFENIYESLGLEKRKNLFYTKFGIIGKYLNKIN